MFFCSSLRRAVVPWRAARLCRRSQFVLLGCDIFVDSRLFLSFGERIFFRSSLRRAVIPCRAARLCRRSQFMIMLKTIRSYATSYLLVICEAIDGTLMKDWSANLHYCFYLLGLSQCLCELSQYLT